MADSAKALAFDSLGWGDGNQDPVMLALGAMRSMVIEFLEMEVFGGSES